MGCYSLYPQPSFKDISIKTRLVIFITFCTCAVLNESLRNLSLGQQRWLASVIYYLVTPTIKHFPEEKSSYWFSLLERIQTFHNEFKQGIGGRDILPPLHTLWTQAAQQSDVLVSNGELHLLRDFEVDKKQLSTALADYVSTHVNLKKRLVVTISTSVRTQHSLCW